MNKTLKLPTFMDGSTKFYKFTNLVPAQQVAPGVTISSTNGLIDRAFLMWRLEEHYEKRMAGKQPEDLGKFYIVHWMAYGPGYYGRENVYDALDYYKKKGWDLVESKGPRKHPGHVPDSVFDPSTLTYVDNVVDVAHYMKRLPKDWDDVNAKVIAEMDKTPDDRQMEMMAELAKKNLQEVIAAVKKGDI